jgi:hypothetical protein
MSITVRKRNILNRNCPMLTRVKLGTELEELQSSILGSITGTWYYVDKNATGASNSNDGLSWSTPWLTITYALSQMTDYDGLMIGCGVYTETGMSIDKEGIKIIGSGTHAIDRTMIKGTNAADDHILTILGNRNEIAGICFKQLAAKQCIVLGTSASVDCYNTHIHDNRFYGTEGASSVATYGIAPNQSGTEPDIPDFIYENNWFYGFTTAAIRAHGTRGMCRYNDIIMLSSGDYGIECPQATDGRPYMSVLFNTITGVNNSDTGIVITNDVEPEYLKIAGNIVLQCAVPMTRARDTEHYESNDLGLLTGMYTPEPRTWFVDENVTGGVTGDGRCKWSAFLTIAEAIAAAGNYDTIKIFPAVYTEDSGDGLEITKTGLRFLGVGPNGEVGGTYKPEVMIKGTDTTALLIVDASHVEIAGIHFKVVGAGKAIQVGDADADSIFGLWVHDCNFIGDGGTGTATGTYGIAGYSTITEWADALIEDNRFLGWTTAAIHGHATRMDIKNNIFWLLTDGDIGIVVGVGALFRPYINIQGNMFCGVTNGVGISIAQTITPGQINISGNTMTGGMTVLATTGLADGDEMGADNSAWKAAGAVQFDFEP